MMAVGFQKSQDDPIIFSPCIQRQVDTGGENSRIVLRFLEWFENTQSDKVEKFELY